MTDVPLKARLKQFLRFAAKYATTIQGHQASDDAQRFWAGFERIRDMPVEHIDADPVATLCAVERICVDARLPNFLLKTFYQDFAEYADFQTKYEAFVQLSSDAEATYLAQVTPQGGISYTFPKRS